jgi:hypothetical protein
VLSVIAKNNSQNAGQIDLPVAPAGQAPAQNTPAPAKSVDDVPAVEHNSAPAAGEVPTAPAQQ